VFAILGMRSLYFCLAALIGRFRYLKPALVAVLTFVGIKMCLVHTPLRVPSDVALLVILGLLGSGVAASLVARRLEVRGGVRQ
jgi:tellurite resistance protein TerC